MNATVNRITPVHRGRVFRLVTENITLSNGVRVDIDVIRHPGAAAIVALLDEKTVLLLRQYRHAVGGWIWEIPAGTLDPQESVEACARRELTEETGYTARDFEKLGEITPLPGYADERIHLFLASGLTPSAQDLDADELLSVHPTPLPRAVEMVLSGEIQDAKTITALLLAERRLQNG
ncbi:MAG: NUDIX hydrolase [Desulfobacteraceae bacterium]|nr:NUDIX hydrolase [Desulfobacteraceae bacterium]